MPNAERPDASGWFRPVLVLVLAITALRVALLAFNRTDLFVDEAQYWLWGQDLAFGYYSKPPLIAWVIRAVTELAGSDAPFWVRLPAPLFHGATALILGSIAARHISARAGVLVAAAFVTLPMVAVGSLLISTDTIMFPFLALALAGYLRLIQPGGGGHPALAIGVGAALGLAFLAKYAAVYYLALAAIAALWPRTRPDTRDAALILAAFAIVAAPNIIWNMINGFSTLSHTVDNTGWRGGVSLDPASLAEFLGSQFAVFGPILLIALVFATWAIIRRADDRTEIVLAVLALPIVLIISVQALISGANANWAAAAYLPGVLLAVAWLMDRWRGWLALSFALNGALCLALPLATLAAPDLRIGGRLVLERYLGLDELSRSLLAEAEARGATAIVATERAVLADLLYTGRTSDMPVFAWPHPGAPRDHYEQRHMFGGQAEGPVLAATRSDRTPPCRSAQPDGILTPGPGAYEGRTFRLWLVPADCWARS